MNRGDVEKLLRTERKGKKGTGLGLAITLELLHLHNSTLQLSSVVGVGTTASFILRLAS
jgi:signal transduction histidine kinase